mmetsp:Transcript_29643/g.84788  ORF Transcript_29643/g.84788 Transcript_29643/m.84788 type:complete len:110 (-) Transcript_29643:533-862(-)
MKLCLQLSLVVRLSHNAGPCPQGCQCGEPRLSTSGNEETGSWTLPEGALLKQLYSTTPSWSPHGGIGRAAFQRNLPPQPKGYPGQANYLTQSCCYGSSSKLVPRCALLF